MCMPHQQKQAHCLSLPCDEPSDEALLSALADGGAWAMEPLYHRYHRLLSALAYRLVADHQIAEDLVQEVFLRVWQRAPLYDPHAGAVRTWLLAILYHRSIDYFRSEQRPPTVKKVTWEPEGSPAV